jgi:hypothetical protein
MLQTTNLKNLFITNYKLKRLICYLKNLNATYIINVKFKWLICNLKILNDIICYKRKILRTYKYILPKIFNKHEDIKINGYNYVYTANFLWTLCLSYNQHFKSSCLLFIFGHDFLDAERRTWFKVKNVVMFLNS